MPKNYQDFVMFFDTITIRTFDYVTPSSCDIIAQNFIALDLGIKKQTVLAFYFVLWATPTVFEPKQVQSAVSQDCLTVQVAGIFFIAENFSFWIHVLFTRDSLTTPRFSKNAIPFDFLVTSLKQLNDFSSNTGRNRFLLHLLRETSPQKGIKLTLILCIPLQWYTWWSRIDYRTFLMLTKTTKLMLNKSKRIISGWSSELNSTHHLLLKFLQNMIFPHVTNIFWNPRASKSNRQILLCLMINKKMTLMMMNFVFVKNDEILKLFRVTYAHIGYLPHSTAAQTQQNSSRFFT